MTPRAASAALARRSRMRRAALVVLVACAVAGAVAHAAASIPVRVRVIRGSRQGPPSIDPRITDVSPQLGRLAYSRWELVDEQRRTMEFNQPVSVALPDGAAMDLTLVDSKDGTVTFEVRVPAHRTRSRLTIARHQRIVQQVTMEQGGVAYFATVKPWP